jgi:Flp pilus assembly pilin Flp
MARSLTIFGVLGLAGLFGWGVPLLRLFDAFQPMIVSLSIMIAAVFVRLNRGMPSLEWKSLDLAKRTELTSQIVNLSREYGWIVALNASGLVGLVTLTVVGKTEVQSSWPSLAQHVTAGCIGGVAALCVARMGYVVWRDLDIVSLQKHLIDASAARDADESENKAANAKIADIRAAGLRKVTTDTPKAWGE